MAFGTAVGALAGLLGGLISSFALASHPGDVRDVIGLGGGSVLGAGGASVMVLSFFSDFR